MTTPIEHVEQGYKKEMDRPVQLFELTLKKSGSILRFCNRPTITWQSHLYNYWPCSMDKDGANANGEKIRPNLVLFNPDGSFTPLAEAGEFDLATLVRKEVLQEHLLANVNLFRQRVWFVARANDVTCNNIVLECHSSTDIPNFQVPARFFAPPDFPFVTY